MRWSEHLPAVALHSKPHVRATMCVWQLCPFDASWTRRHAHLYRAPADHSHTQTLAQRCAHASPPLLLQCFHACSFSASILLPANLLFSLACWLQGSNLFIRLGAVVQAGLFDESLPSTTDRQVRCGAGACIGDGTHPPRLGCAGLFHKAKKQGIPR